MLNVQHPAVAVDIASVASQIGQQIGLDGASHSLLQWVGLFDKFNHTLGGIGGNGNMHVRSASVLHEHYGQLVTRGFAISITDDERPGREPVYKLTQHGLEYGRKLVAATAA